jgi:hypothetical protein
MPIMELVGQISRRRGRRSDPLSDLDPKDNLESLAFILLYRRCCHGTGPDSVRDTLQPLENSWITPNIWALMNPLTISASVPFSKIYAN